MYIYICKYVNKYVFLNVIFTKYVNLNLYVCIFMFMYIYMYTCMHV
jgi:hypothetical protein